jgi:hypothetical protein
MNPRTEFLYLILRFETVSIIVKSQYSIIHMSGFIRKSLINVWE